MRTFITIAAALFAGVASATNSEANAFKNPAGGYTFTVGEPTTLTWNADAGTTVTLRLQHGSVSTANSGTIIASSIDNDGSYTWNVPSDLAYESDYTIEIIDDQDTSNYNFSPRFTVSGAVVATTTTSASSTSTSATSTSTTVSTTSTSSTKTSSSSSATPTTMTTSSSSASSTASSTTQSSTSAASTSASSTTSAASVPTTNAGVVNRVSGGLLAAVAGAAMLL
ncbi:cell wall protein [Penicillium cataractarum]|uniref:Cell wall protein n=1 Tax=Penicillium cataractarum TaxID=2100454 RepID=A0A9W9REA4_9EURO|nr:cell wall protein [Penicillium cataractarum]KAJ5358655.1 cell wall protein [Penicillium cataractarum]